MVLMGGSRGGVQGVQLEKTWNHIPRCQENAYTIALEFSIFSERFASGACAPAVFALFQRLHPHSRNPGSAPEC
jgi:hypothetical protein